MKRREEPTVVRNFHVVLFYVLIGFLIGWLV